MPYTGAGAILYYKDAETGVYYILVGHESQYLQDSISDMKIVNSENGLLFDTQTLTQYQTVVASSLREAMAQFDSRARMLSESVGQQIRYDKPISSDSTVYRTHFRTCSGKIGICKGRHEPHDKSIYDTALREIKEETGIVLKTQNVTGVYQYNKPHMKHTAYMIELTEAQRQESMVKISVRNADYYGELFNLHFLPLIGKYDKNMNAITSLGVYDFLRLMKKRERA